MSQIAPTVQLFFTERLTKQLQASPHTLAAYRDTFRLLFAFLKQRSGKPPSTLAWEDLHHDAISAFLEHLEIDRNNSARTRNIRLGAIRSLINYASMRHPEHAALFVGVLSIPPKRFAKAAVSYLTPQEIDALIAAPDRSRWEGRRDHALLMLAIQTGLRVSELTQLNVAGISTATGAHVQCLGKGRKHRAVPLTLPTAKVLRQWLTERNGGPDTPLFPTRTGKRLSRDAVAQRLATHYATAVLVCTSLQTKNVSPHTLRHTAAMTLLQAGVDSTVIALWLGHADVRSTSAYLQADMTIKQRALDLTTPTSSPPGRYQAPDALMAFLENM